jgi:hypothetical protein
MTFKQKSDIIYCFSGVEIFPKYLLAQGLVISQNLLAQASNILAQL